MTLNQAIKKYDLTVTEKKNEYIKYESEKDTTKANYIYIVDKYKTNNYILTIITTYANGKTTVTNKPLEK